MLTVTPNGCIFVSMNKSLNKAIKIAGNQEKLGKICDVSQQTVSKWVKKGRVPIDRIEPILIFTNFEISAEDLHPKLKKITRMN